MQEVETGMVKTLNLHTEIPASHELRITIPSDVPAGPADIVVMVSSPPAPAPDSTAGQLANSEFFGMWRDRTELPESGEFARKLREEGWTRQT